MCTPFLSTPSNTNDVILPHEENHGITLRRLKQVLIPVNANPAMQGIQTQGASHLLRHPAGTLYRFSFVLAHEASIQCPWATCGSPS